MEKEEYLFKVVVVGDWSVGKSSLLYRYNLDDFPLNLMMTIGCDFMKKIEKVDEWAVCLQVWDHSSSERYWRGIKLNNFPIFISIYCWNYLNTVKPFVQSPHEIGKISVVDKIWFKFRLFFIWIITKIKNLYFIVYNC